MTPGVLLALALAFPPKPWNPLALEHFDAGRKYQEQSLYPYAIDQFQLSLSTEPHPQTERALGECFAEMKQPLLACIHLERFADKGWPDAESLNRLGCLQLQLNKVDDARKTFVRLEPLDGESAHTGLTQVELQLARKSYDAHDWKASAEHFRAALDLSHGDPRALDGLAHAERMIEESAPKRPRR